MFGAHHVKQISLTAPMSQHDCRRCGGLIVKDKFPELDTSMPGMAAYRCVQCGDIVDSVILENRSRRPGRAEAKRGVQQWQL